MRVKTLTLAFAAMVAMAFAVPAIASANWTEEGEELAGLQWSQDGAPLNSGSGSFSLSGPLKWTSSNGGIECAASGSGTLDAASSTGQVNELTISPASCKLHGAIGFACPKVTGVTVGALPWSVTATESAGVRKVTISGVTIAYNLTGSAYCDANISEVTVIGSITGTPDNSASISSLSPSGSGQLYGPKKESLGGISFVSGASSLGVSPAGKYGIIKRTAEVDVSGTLGWSSAGGGMSCSVDGELALEAGSGGKVPSFDWSGCTLSGSKAFCGKVTSVTSNSLPWTLVDQGSTIEIANVSFTVAYQGCSSDTFTGKLVATPDNASAISSTGLSGTLQQNGGAGPSWSGSLSWTPAGVFGL